MVFYLWSTAVPHRHETLLSHLLCTLQDRNVQGPAAWFLHGPWLVLIQWRSHIIGGLSVKSTHVLWGINSQSSTERSCVVFASSYPVSHVPSSVNSGVYSQSGLNTYRYHCYLIRYKDFLSTYFTNFGFSSVDHKAMTRWSKGDLSWALLHS